jgi:hypothetical protein
LEAGQFSLPFYAAAVLQSVYLAWYRKAFRFYEPPRKRPGESAEPTVTRAPSEEEMG